MKFRPEHDLRGRAVKEAEHDDNPDSPVEWEDNRASNLLAWASYRITPAWCQTPEHWTSRLTQHLFTDCPCCLLFRGIAIGVLVGWGGWLIVVLVYALITRVVLDHG